MSKEKITITEIIDLMNGKNNFSKKQSEEFVKMLLSTIEDTLIEGESVKIKDLGTFKPQWNEPRKSVDVNTGDEIIIPGFYKVVFTPDNEFKELVNKPYAHLEPVEQSTVLEKAVSMEKTPESAVTEPMRMFEEQAVQIKEILYEIEALSGKFKNEETDNKLVSETSDVSKNEETVEEQNVETNGEVTSDDEITEEDEFVEKQISENEMVIDEQPDEEITEMPDDGTQYTYTFEDSKTRKWRKKIEREERRKKRRAEISQYFAENKFDLVREVRAESSAKTAVNQSVVPEMQEDKENFEVKEVEEVKEDKEVEEVKEVKEVEEVNDVIEDKEDSEDKEVSEYKEVAEVTESKEEEKIPVLEEVVEHSDVVENAQKTVPEVEINDKDAVDSQNNEVESVEEKSETTEIIVSEPETKADEIIEPVDNEANYTFTQIEKKRRPVWLFIVIPVLLALLAYGIWYYFPNIKAYFKPFFSTDKEQVLETNHAKIPAVETTKPVLATDSVPKQIKDSVRTEDIFNVERQYREFLATEVLKPGIQLSSLAKKYLNHRYFWVYIYEANKDVIKDPNNIPVGTPIKIPKVDYRLINVDNPECFKYAEKLANEYLRKNTK